MKKKYFITTPIYYVNAKPHIGQAYTTVAADVLARFYREQGSEVFLLTGTDEHGLKIQKRAEESGMDPQNFVDDMSKEFKNLWRRLDIQYDGFIRTSDSDHKNTVQKVLQKLFERGVIYKGEYEGLYCIGCEQFKNENELVDGRCADHDTICEKVKEESYLLKMEGRQKELVEKIKRDEFEIHPEKYKKEVLSFLESQPLKDISISRKNVKWGIPLPFDADHTAYVWFDAFLNYLTGLGWNGSFYPSAPSGQLPSGREGGLLDKFWPADLQIIGKDILRVHATIWPVMLLHLGMELPKKIFVHGHLISGGRKMSKTIGNTISIEDMLEKFGTDGTRYLLLSAGTFGEDVDVTMERMIEKYNADLANGLGNLLSRVLRLAQNFQSPTNSQPIPKDSISEFVDTLEIDKAIEEIWEIVRADDKFIEDNRPWELARKNKEKFIQVMNKLVGDLLVISRLLVPFMPNTSEKIKKALEMKRTDILFPRLK